MTGIANQPITDKIRNQVVSRHVSMFSEALDVDIDKEEFFYFIVAWRVETSELGAEKEMHTYRTCINQPILEDGDWLLFGSEMDCRTTCRIPKNLVQYIELCIRPKSSEQTLIDRYKNARLKGNDK